MIRAHQLRKLAVTEEVDYNFLMGALQGLSNPRVKIGQLLKQEALIRVKKGLYVFGPDLAREPYHPEILANLIFGPSYVSLQSALAYYGLIPERVAVMTSVTPKRDKRFKTPVGSFTYKYLRKDLYALGYAQVAVGAPKSAAGFQRHALMATPEKATTDLLVLQGPRAKSARELMEYLMDDVRMDPDALARFDLARLSSIGRVARDTDVDFLIELCHLRRTLHPPIPLSKGTP